MNEDLHSPEELLATSKSVGGFSIVVGEALRQHTVRLSNKLKPALPPPATPVSTDHFVLFPLGSTEITSDVSIHDICSACTRAMESIRQFGSWRLTSRTGNFLGGALCFSFMNFEHSWFTFHVVPTLVTGNNCYLMVSNQLQVWNFIEPQASELQLMKLFSFAIHDWNAKHPNCVISPCISAAVALRLSKTSSSSTLSLFMDVFSQMIEEDAVEFPCFPYWKIGLKLNEQQKMELRNWITTVRDHEDMLQLVKAQCLELRVSHPYESLELLHLNDVVTTEQQRQKLYNIVKHPQWWEPLQNHSIPIVHSDPVTSNAQIFPNVSIARVLFALENIGCREATDLITQWVKRKEKFEASLDDIGEWKWLKLFVVGDAGAGKTSICRWLVDEDFDPNPSNTEGADIIITDVQTQNWGRVKSFDTSEMLADTSTFKKSSTVKMDEDPTYASELRTNPQTTTASSLDQDPVEKLEGQMRSLRVTTTDLLDNIDAYTQKLASGELPMTFQVWDFGGEEVYYNTHHFFLSSAAVFLVVVDLTRSVGEIQERTKFWLRSVRSYAPNAPILVVGTHEDLVPTEEYKEKLWTIWTEYTSVESNANTGNCFSVSCKIPDETLRTETRSYLKVIAEQVIEQFNLKYPKRWMLLYHIMEKEVRSEIGTSNDNNNSTVLTCLPLQRAETFAAQCGMNREELLKALELFHKLGFVFYYASNTALNQTIFVKPQELVDALKTVITVKKQISESAEFFKKMIFRPGVQKQAHIFLPINRDEKLLRQGILTAQRMKQIWTSKEVCTQLRTLLQLFELAIPDPRSDKPEEECDFLVPCMVEQGPEPDQDKSLFPFVFVYQLEVVPPLGLLSRLMVKALQLAKKSQGHVLCRLFEKGCTFKASGLHVRLDAQVDKVKIRVQQEGNKDKIISFLDDLDQFYKQQIGKFSRQAKCIKCNIKFKATEWGFYCQACAYILTDTRFESNSNDEICYLRDLLNNEDYRWNRLCKVLDSSKFWRTFGAHALVRKPFDELERMEKSKTYDPEYSPSKAILMDWRYTSESTVDNFLRVMKDINCETAIRVVAEWKQSVPGNNTQSKKQKI